MKKTTKKPKRPKLAYPTFRQPKYPRQYAFVKLSEWAQEHDEDHRYTNLLGPGPYTFFGEIPNMPGHCIVMNSIKNFAVGMHTDNFVELTEDET